MKRLFAIMALLCAIAPPLPAIEPDEMLADPALEARARALELELRCIRCQSEAIASSNADWARDARVILRERILAGDSDVEALDFFVARYGEIVLMRPRASGSNWILWGAGPAMLLMAVGLAGIYLRRRSADNQAPDALSADEKARLDRILKG